MPFFTNSAQVFGTCFEARFKARFNARLRRGLAGYLLCCLVAASLGLPAQSSVAQTIRFPSSFNETHPHPNYIYSLDLLKLALSKVNNSEPLVSVKTTEPQARILNEMRASGAFDVFWASTTVELERDFLPIRICLLKGLNGWRIPVVAKGQQHLLAGVKKPADLLNFSVGLGFGWTDVEVFKAAGIKVERSYTIEKIYAMLAAHRFDYFPRGLQEVWQELDEARDERYQADTHLVIRYPSPVYFLVRRERPELAQKLQTGLELALKDGSFDKLFYKYFKSNLIRTDLAHRRIIEIPNPLLPPLTPLKRAELWFDVNDGLGH